MFCCRVEGELFKVDTSESGIGITICLLCIATTCLRESKLTVCFLLDRET